MHLRDDYYVIVLNILTTQQILTRVIIFMFTSTYFTTPSTKIHTFPDFIKIKDILSLDNSQSPITFLNE
jgi:hypothetical protein